MTTISIEEDKFYIDGEVTYAGRAFRDDPIEGLLMNSRMIQATYDDVNPETVGRWAYPDTGKWDAERNVDEFINTLPVYRDHGVLGLTLNFQGGSPEGYSKEQPWHNYGYTIEGDLLPAYAERMKRAIDRMDQLGMVAILGCFYFGQDQQLKDERAVIRAVDNTIEWVFQQGYQNVIIEINNECNIRKYVHDILKPDRIHELIDRAKAITQGGRRLLVSTSYGGRFIPLENVVRSGDFLLIHGNGVTDPDVIVEMVEKTRQVEGYSPKPILFNEDDHFEFDKPWNHFLAAVSQYASWGFFDPGESNYKDGYQSPPVNWGLSTDIKKGFFELAKEMTGY